MEIEGKGAVIEQDYFGSGGQYFDGVNCLFFTFLWSRDGQGLRNGEKLVKMFYKLTKKENQERN